MLDMVRQGSGDGPQPLAAPLSPPFHVSTLFRDRQTIGMGAGFLLRNMGEPLFVMVRQGNGESPQLRAAPSRLF